MFGFMNSDYIHEYYGYLVPHPELLPVLGSNADFKALLNRGSLLGSTYVIGNNNNNEDNENDDNNNNNNNEEGA